MFLSKVVVHGAACRNPYEIHRVLWNLFPGDPDASRDFLFRVERAGLQTTEILMQSHRDPSPADIKGAHVIATKPYAIAPAQGQRFRFMLLANPIKSIKDGDGRKNAKGEVKSCRVPLIRDEEMESWFLRKLEGSVKVEMVTVEKRPVLHFRKPRAERVGNIQPVSFQGVFSVVDPIELSKRMKTGIGPAKAFGCGLLSIARA